MNGDDKEILRAEVAMEPVRSNERPKADPGSEPLEANSEPAIDRGVQKHLGRKLQASYEDLVSQPVPERFRRLLEELEQREKKK